MRRKTTDAQTKSGGFYIDGFVRGFFGEKSEGSRMLRMMGLPAGTVPFSVAVFLQNRTARWTDKDGNVASISFEVKPGQMECSGSYLRHRKSMRLYREWNDYEDAETVARLESEAIGDLCMRCIFENMA